MYASFFRFRHFLCYFSNYQCRQDTHVLFDNNWSRIYFSLRSVYHNLNTCKWLWSFRSHLPGSNRGHPLYKSGALPTELRWHNFALLFKASKCKHYNIITKFKNRGPASTKLPIRNPSKIERSTVIFDFSATTDSVYHLFAMRVKECSMFDFHVDFANPKENMEGYKLNQCNKCPLV